MTLHAYPDLSKHDNDIVIRSAAHTLADAVTPDSTRLRNDVTDFDIARLMLALETGQVIVPDGRGWKALDVRPLLQAFVPHLYTTISEALRLGLVHLDSVRTSPGIVRHQLVGAAVHLRRETGRTMCAASLAIPFMRYRLVDDEDLVDCTACLLANR